MENIFQEYNDPFYKETLNFIKECDIACINAEYDYLYENTFYQESMTDNIFTRFIGRICESIIKLFNNFITSVKNLFKRQNHITIDDFINSDVGKIKISKDVEKINAEIDDEIIKGSKLVQSISRGTRVDDHTVNKFLDKVSLLLRSNKDVIITNTVANAVVKSSEKKAEKNKKIISDLNEEITKNKEDIDEESKITIQKIMNGLQSLSAEYISNYSEIISQLTKQNIN